jgi:hypothetical protein
MRNAKAGPTNTHRDVAPMFYNTNYKLEENYVSYEGYCYDSIHIISKKLYEDWFCIGNWDDALNFILQIYLKRDILNYLELME